MVQLFGSISSLEVQISGWLVLQYTAAYCSFLKLRIPLGKYMTACCNIIIATSIVHITSKP